mmetsp:Transcript_9331/g.23399  ORF Transcript_9331/g.23399 Transcript_9331/m.23399 type:complete len:85 (-) Transcript_9331:184-438(-)
MSSIAEAILVPSERASVTGAVPDSSGVSAAAAPPFERAGDTVTIEVLAEALAFPASPVFWWSSCIENERRDDRGVDRGVESENR